MNKEVLGQLEKYTEFYNNKSLKHAAFIVSFYAASSMFVIFGSENSYSTAFYLNLILFIVYSFSESQDGHFTAPSLVKEKKAKVLETAVSNLCFCTWVLVFEVFLYGLNSSKLLAFYSLLGGFAFVAVFAQLPFYINHKLNSLLIYFILIWFFRIGVLAFLVLFITSSIYGDWSVNVLSPINLLRGY